MIQPVTKVYMDKSNIKQFSFVFYCDCCGRELPAAVQEFRSAFQKKRFLTNGEMEARAIIYASEHAKAYERANNEILHELNRCEICGAMICESCSVYPEHLGGGVCCRKCAEKER